MGACDRDGNRHVRGNSRGRPRGGEVKREEREHRFWAPWHHGVLAKGARTLTQGQQ